MRRARPRRAPWPTCAGRAVRLTRLSRGPFGITASMSRKANCFDNAPMESFFHILKTELVHHWHYPDRAEGLARHLRLHRVLLQSNPASFRDRICRPDPDGAKSSLKPSSFSGRRSRPHLPVYRDLRQRTAAPYVWGDWLPIARCWAGHHVRGSAIGLKFRIEAK
jgi:hypothetical protein